MTDISLCMIVKNEERFIADCLAAVKAHTGIGDIVVVDTGSSDNTKAIAKTCGARVFDFRWNGDFSAARNFASEKAVNDWIFFVDADEFADFADMKALSALNLDEDVIGEVKLTEMTDMSSEYLSRLYNKSRYAFEGTIHEQLRRKSGGSGFSVRIPVTMGHYGKLYRSKAASDNKYNYYIELLLKALADKPNDPYLLCQLGKVYAFFPERLGEASECFEKALDSKPDLNLSYIAGAIVRYGYCLINSGRWEDALGLIAEYNETYRKYDEFLFLKAQVYQNNGMFVEAVESYERCLASESGDSKGINTFLSFYNIGVILETIGMEDDAVGMYENCGSYKPALDRLSAMGR